MRDDVFEKAMDLYLADRAELTRDLLQGLEQEEEAEYEDPQSVEAAWDAELVRRLDDFDSGRVNGVDGWEVIREMKAKNEEHRRQIQKKRH